MADRTRSGSIERIRRASAGVCDAFQAMRGEIDRSGPLNAKTRELILLAGFTTARQESNFKAHCARAVDEGASRQEIYQSILLTLGACATLNAVSLALDWADEMISPS
ncbi:MAG: hypothetical protein HW416_1154 [Chloroflexi bacterium]|nr:hypothetical protein [Chloroflexota bacterium]